MFIKLAIYMLLAYFAYKAWKAVKTINEVVGKKVRGGQQREIDEELVLDPFCQTYFQKRNGVRYSRDGEDLYFCSPECRDKFIAENKQHKTGECQ